MQVTFPPLSRCADPYCLHEEFRIGCSVQGDNAHLFFECLWVDKKAGKIAAHTNADDVLVRVHGKWLIKEMKAGKVGEL